MKFSLLSAVAILSFATSAKAAIVSIAGNGDKTWTIGSLVVSFETEALVADRLKFSTTVNILSNGEVVPESFRRDNDLTGTTTNNLLVLPYSTPGTPPASQSGQFGAINNSTDNWLVFSSKNNGDFDTAIQLSLDDSAGITGDSIVQVWHDNAASGANVISGVSKFSDITASAIPEPSSALLLGLSGSLMLIRRRRS